MSESGRERKGVGGQRSWGRFSAREAPYPSIRFAYALFTFFLSLVSMDGKRHQDFLDAPPRGYKYVYVCMIV